MTVAIRCYRQAEYLGGAVESVLRQSFRDHEIVIVDDGSPDDTREVAAALASAHPGRAIRLVSQENRGLSGALDAGARAARGELLLFLDADDELLPDVLARLVTALEESPECAIAYGDVLQFGGREGLLRAGTFELGALSRGNQLPYCSLYRRELWARAGGYQRNMSLGYEDWDFWLACAEAGARARRIPEPVLRYRVKAESAVTTAMKHHALLCSRLMLNHPALYDPEELAAARARLAAGAAALEREAASGGDPATARRARALLEEPGPAEGSRPTPTTPAPPSPEASVNPVHRAAPPPAVSLVVAANGPWEQTFRTLMALLEDHGGVGVEIIVVDNGSTDASRLALPRLENVRVVRCEAAQGRARAFNLGSSVATGRHLAFLQGGVEPRVGWLSPLVSLLDGNETVGVAGAVLLAQDGAVVFNGCALAYAKPFPLTPVALGDRGGAVLEVPAVSDEAMLVRADLFRSLGGFDDQFWDGCEDVDLCLRARAAGKVVLISGESAVIRHAAQAADPGTRNLSLLNRRWLGRAPLADVDGVRGAPSRPARPGRPPLSVIIPTANSLTTVARCVEETWAELAPDDELILADAASEDGTRQFADLLATERPERLRVVPARSEAGLAGAVRSGMLECSRAWAVLLPARVSPPPGFLDELTALLEQQAEYAAIAVQIPELGLCAAGRSDVLADIARSSPEVFLDVSPVALDLALKARGERVLVAGS
ncbi:glycosyltransferase [Anaeromyxobacter paludicola]|uniref:Glycosyltransferase 2-like domain-containing protein n=1 Tax=Anaeromyxobacter paludicola TaxID=2918171 RepID=A0ABN6N503_9BACT|nr:glycosyltransferase [Anaeromyxobacter paludicola]BDG07079.1 hypothetical protein AMPC_01920 [Anaeromyxobacter paludicola]